MSMRNLVLSSVLGLGALLCAGGEAQAQGVQLQIGGGRGGFQLYVGPGYNYYRPYPYNNYRYSPDYYRYNPDYYRRSPDYYRYNPNYYRPYPNGPHWNPRQGWHYDYTPAPRPHYHR